jgi:hypothetical protein
MNKIDVKNYWEFTNFASKIDFEMHLFSMADQTQNLFTDYTYILLTTGMDVAVKVYRKKFTRP